MGVQHCAQRLIVPRITVKPKYPAAIEVDADLLGEHLDRPLGDSYHTGSDCGGRLRRFIPVCEATSPPAMLHIFITDGQEGIGIGRRRSDSGEYAGSDFCRRSARLNSGTGCG